MLLAPAFGAGIIVGPSFGHFYAGNTRQAWIGIGLRTIGGGVFLRGVANELDDEITLCLKRCSGQSSMGDGPDTSAAIVFGAVVVGSSLIYDIATADNSARQYNRAHGLQARVAPTVGGPRGKQAGLALAVRF